MVPEAKQELIDLLIKRGTVYRETAIRLATGEETHTYLDVKNVVRDGKGLFVAALAFTSHVAILANGGFTSLNGVTAIGGPTMGADVLAHSIALLGFLTQGGDHQNWFAIRDHVKTDHGMGKLIEGAELGPDDKVLITDDVANSGKSLVEAVEAVRQTGATVVAVIPLVDRSDQTAAKMLALDVPYFPLLTSADLGLAPLKAA